MVTKQMIDDFIGQKILAVVGASRSRSKFGNAILRDLKKKGYRVFAVNPRAERIEGDRCFPDLLSIPEPVGGAVVVVKPGEAAKVVGDALKAGIARLWLQQGSESDEALALVRGKNISLIHGHCLLMFIEPLAWYHRFHRFLWRMLGKLPRA